MLTSHKTTPKNYFEKGKHPGGEECTKTWAAQLAARRENLGNINDNKTQWRGWADTGWESHFTVD